MSVIYYFLPGVLILGALASYFDITENRIPNYIILLSFVYAFLAFLVVLTTSGYNFSISYFTNYFTNLFACFVVGFLLFYFRVWAPGDAKLFIAFAAMLPLESYMNYAVPYFPSIVLFTNIFVVSTVFVAFLILFKGKKFYMAIYSKLFSRKSVFEFGGMILTFVALLWFILFLFSKTVQEGFLVYILVFIFYLLFNKIVKNTKIRYSIIAVLVLLRVLFYFETLFSSAYLFSLLKYVFIFFLFKKIFLESYQEVNIKRIDAKEIKPYMVLVRGVTHKKLKLKKGSSIAPKELRSIKSLRRKIWVKETLPFAPLMLAGALLTMIIRGEIISFLF